MPGFRPNRHKPAKYLLRPKGQIHSKPVRRPPPLREKHAAKNGAMQTSWNRTIAAWILSLVEWFVWVSHAALVSGMARNCLPQPQRANKSELVLAKHRSTNNLVFGRGGPVAQAQMWRCLFYSCSFWISFKAANPQKKTPPICKWWLDLPNSHSRRACLTRQAP